jgi:hypothetical protein
MSMQDLSLVLWCERDLLETLQYKLEVEQLVLDCGRPHRLATAAREVETVVDRIRALEVLRALEVDVLAVELGLAPDPPLHDLAAACAEPWRTIWQDHRRALITLTAEITAGTTRVHELLVGTQDTAPAPAARSGWARPSGVLADEAVDRELQALARDLAVGAVSRAFQPSLQDFLR